MTLFPLSSVGDIVSVSMYRFDVCVDCFRSTSLVSPVSTINVYRRTGVRGFTRDGYFDRLEPPHVPTTRYQLRSGGRSPDGVSETHLKETETPLRNPRRIFSSGRDRCIQRCLFSLKDRMVGLGVSFTQPEFQDLYRY